MIENLRAEDPEMRLSSMRGIHVITQTLGPDRTKNELIPFLTDYLDDNDEVLRIFANALGTMIPEVGGIQFAPALLHPLELLCGLDEITVRDEAVASLQIIGDTVFKTDGTAALQQDFIGLVQRLAKSDLPQARSSACSVVAVPYPHVPVGVKATLRQTFQKLCSDEEIMVRRSACVALGKVFASILGQQATDLLTPFASFCRDSSDGVRLQAVTTAISMLRVLPDSGISQVVSLLKTLSSDSSWRVRYMAADRLGEIAKAFSPQDAQRVCAPMFRTMCQDSEPEIRASAVHNMSHLLSVVTDATVRKDILNVGTRLAGDQNAHVRMCLASSVLKSSLHAPPELWATSIVGTCTRLLQDTDADVRLALLSGFNEMGDTAGAKELAPKLVPVVVGLFADPKWRIRETVVSQVATLVTALGKSADDVLDVCVKALQDRVASIRSSGCDSCCKLLEQNGAQWFETVLIPRVQPMVQSGSFMPRITVLQLFASLASAPQLDARTVQRVMLPTFNALVNDKVANVRLNVAKAILALRDHGKVTRGDVEGYLDRLSHDADEDVKDAAAGLIGGTKSVV
ncbi:serine-threonine protein phosphatase, putative [Bodo saltans]|uniref:Serine-threonine protein phosphatase, putative n=1 Tax=Bodo saltans TaxID=75058 RepID=A0A0S4J2C5_BODSA|nr:serine-threonine protein phosphatase, putative [Bodo saltans]|eukprot:CUG67704.1 serine-threonine protein phosphatase, putative [Bodo saltans]